MCKANNFFKKYSTNSAMPPIDDGISTGNRRSHEFKVEGVCPSLHKSRTIFVLDPFAFQCGSRCYDTDVTVAK